VVLRIVNGDTIEVASKQGGSRRTIQFSSIRQPKTADPKQVAWQAEVREYLRKRLIGKTVHVQIDYTKPASEGFGARDAATVTFGGKNVAHDLVERGYATVIRHRKDDEDRSPTYDTLLELEQKYWLSFISNIVLKMKPREFIPVRSRSMRANVSLMPLKI
jgi:staphylococcal nuclease domain-containing protein 1